MRDINDPKMGKARANNLLRHILQMPVKEEEDLEQAVARGEDPSHAKAALERTVRAVLPQPHYQRDLQQRIDPAQAVILTCGNPFFMADIETIANSNHIRFEKEDW